jgi:TraM recognition site of TraD and TraG
VIVINGAKAVAGEDNTRLLFQLLLRLVHRAIQAQQTLPEPRRRRVSLYVDEAHNVLTPSVATMLAEGRSAGLEACFAWQYAAQIRDELVRSGVRSLLQSISIFRMRELEDARALAGLAMDVYSDRISVDQQEQERLRFSADDIIHLPVHTAINIWVARGTPRPAFVARTQPMQDLYDPALAEHHLAAQRERGGRYLAHLPAPLGDKRSADAPPPSGAPHVSGPNGTDPDSGRRARPADGANPGAVQLPFEDL